MRETTEEARSYDVKLVAKSSPISMKQLMCVSSERYARARRKYNAEMIKRLGVIAIFVNTISTVHCAATVQLSTVLCPIKKAKNDDNFSQ